MSATRRDAWFALSRDLLRGDYHRPRTDMYVNTRDLNPAAHRNARQLGDRFLQLNHQPQGAESQLLPYSSYKRPSHTQSRNVTH